ncbi:universal stress protein [Psychroserpens mesophilus]|uniref:universal stress protein n=1 Tax=Psychroserpens mesophilus TaxID=325473 RepID=UPI00058F8766|nr:universal stress protein [Psychroserpens mesophilus]
MSKYKILVLTDMKDTTINTLKNGVSLAKIIDAEIHLFHVKKPTDIVEQESQLSAIRTMNRSYVSTDSEIQNLIEPVSKDHNIPISYSHVFGNLKNEINSIFKSYKPDVVILGKNKSKPFSFIGDNVTNFVIKNFDGAIMIVDNANNVTPDKQISLGVLNSFDSSLNVAFSKHLITHAAKPLKSFKIIKNTSDFQNTKSSLGQDVTEYVFEHNQNSVKNLSGYLSKSNINLLFIDRVKSQTKTQSIPISDNLNDVIAKLNVSFLLSEQK